MKTDGSSLYMYSLALMPLAALLIRLLSNKILKSLPDGRLKRLLSRRLYAE